MKNLLLRSISGPDIRLNDMLVELRIELEEDLLDRVLIGLAVGLESLQVVVERLPGDSEHAVDFVDVDFGRAPLPRVHERKLSVRRIEDDQLAQIAG